MKILVDTLIEWPRSVARHLEWLGPLFARIVTGWVFLWTGWGKLTHLPLVTQNFEGWGIPAPQLLAPFASGVEFFGGILLLVGLLTRISAGALGVVMIVAVSRGPVAGSRLVADASSASRKSCTSPSSCGSPSPAPGRVSLDHLLGRARPHDRITPRRPKQFTQWLRAYQSAWEGRDAAAAAQPVHGRRALPLDAARAAAAGSGRDRSRLGSGRQPAARHPLHFQRVRRRRARPAWPTGVRISRACPTSSRSASRACCRRSSPPPAKCRVFREWWHSAESPG